jgi:CheY-like chemotaxis protein
MPAENPIRVLLIEDDPADTQRAISICAKLGLEAQSRITVLAARDLLEDVAEGVHPAPHVIVLDLGFIRESGFEVLRYWKSMPSLNSIPVIVWTQAGDREREIAAYFHVAAVVLKSDGLEELESALKRVIAGLA